jgi:hypothetical protein
MKAILIILSIIFLVRSFNAQNPEEFENLYKNHIFFEIGGVAIASLNFEKTFVTKENVKFNYRIGLSYMPLVVNGKSAIGTPIVPHGIFYLNGKKNHLELGLNNAISYTFDNISNEDEFHYNISPSIGYRYENFNSKSIYFSIAYSPIVRFTETESVFNHWGRVSIGYLFN